MACITINPERLLADLGKLRSFGACGNGVVRQAFSKIDVLSRQWLCERISSAGLKPAIDPAGNVFGLPPGNGKCLLIGSHSDTQPEGGWLDGAYGVILGLEIARASIESGGPPIAVVSFQDEEGRFGGLTGSSIWSGRLKLDDADLLTDTSGQTFGHARRAMYSMCREGFVPADRFSGFIEAHIEQGPVLDRHNQSIGVVDNIVGYRSNQYRFTGEQNHAGTTPMALRRDAFQGLVQFTTEINNQFSEIVTEATVWTIGFISVHPNAPSIVPGQVDFSVQWRDASNERLDRMAVIVEETLTRIAMQFELEVEISATSAIMPTQIDAQLRNQLEGASERLAPGNWRRMPSGALHDAANVSLLMPVAMLFVPSIGGLSHTFAEDTALEHLVLGAEVLANGVSI